MTKLVYEGPDDTDIQSLTAVTINIWNLQLTADINDS